MGVEVGGAQQQGELSVPVAPAACVLGGQLSYLDVKAQQLADESVTNRISTLGFSQVGVGEERGGVRTRVVSVWFGRWCSRVVYRVVVNVMSWTAVADPQEKLVNRFQSSSAGRKGTTAPHDRNRLPRPNLPVQRTLQPRFGQSRFDPVGGSFPRTRVKDY